MERCESQFQKIPSVEAAGPIAIVPHVPAILAQDLPLVVTEREPHAR